MSVIREIEKERERERKISFGALLRLKRERERVGIKKEVLPVCMAFNRESAKHTLEENRRLP